MRKVERAKIFIPHELKTIEINIEKQIFRVNGEDFGSSCDEFRINCNTKRSSSEYIEVAMYIKSGILFANYDLKGKKQKKNTEEKEGFGNNRLMEAQSLILST